MSFIQDGNRGSADLFTGLNEEQAKAVRHVDGPLLILAGAGSGKTRVLVHRIAYLILEAGVAPWSILGITFTNKAAKEMKTRVEALLPEVSNTIWISTFHAACVRILRRDIERIGFSRNFSILDYDDQLKLIKECISDNNLSDKMFAPKAVLEQIGRAKDETLSPADYLKMQSGDAHKAKIAHLYATYQARLKKLNALDFDDIILMTIKLFNDCSDVLAYYQNRFVHILVDEYQDTNTAQYVLISLLSAKWRNLCVVGDDDQSIYGWRGANINNILGFEKEYRDAAIIKLEQNYRSTKVILSAANSVIHKNRRRKPKSLWTGNEEGAVIGCVKSYNEHEEASFTAQALKRLRLELGIGYNEFAVLYRINAQSRAMENMLIREGVPYRIIGGYKFFDRKEIKDIIAYLRLLINPADDISFKRVINVPRRGVGAVTIAKLEDYALANDISLFEATEFACMNRAGLPIIKSAVAKLDAFVRLIKDLTAASKHHSVADTLEFVLMQSGIYAMYENDRSEDAKARYENILELKSEIIEFEDNFEGDEIFFDEGAQAIDGGANNSETNGMAASKPTLSEFLMHITLISDIDNYEEDDEKVSLMTVHSAKGLEYDTVFVVGAEEGIFPGVRAMSDATQLEEERRLCYVAITRAKKRLIFSYAVSRTLFGNTTYNRLSRFVSDIPNNIISDNFDDIIDRPASFSAKQSSARRRTGAMGGGHMSAPGGRHAAAMGGMRGAAASGKYTAGQDGFAKRGDTKADDVLDADGGVGGAYENGRVYMVGDKVGHKKYGDGTVTNRYRDKGDYIIEIEFIDAGMKRFIESMVNLRVSGD